MFSDFSPDGESFVRDRTRSQGTCRSNYGRYPYRCRNWHEISGVIRFDFMGRTPLMGHTPEAVPPGTSCLAASPFCQFKATSESVSPGPINRISKNVLASE